MKLGLISLLISITLISCVPDEDNVLVLDDKTFDEEIQKHKALLIEFYAPWCGHCKTLAPEYSKAAEILKQDNPPIYLAKIDATVNNELAQKFSIEGFPTIKLWVNNGFKDYEGGRTATEIVNWVRKRTSSPSKALRTVEDIENFKKSNDVVAIYFGDIDSDSFKVYVKVASSIDDVDFAHVSNSEVASHYGVLANQVLLLKNFDEGKNTFTDPIEEQTLADFVNYNALRLINKFEERVAETIFGRSKSAIFLLRTEGEASKLDGVLTPVARKFKGKIIFVSTAIEGEFEERLAEYFSVTEKDLPHLRICEVKAEDEVKFYVHSGEITEESIELFINDFFAGKLSPYFKSEEIPTEQKESVFYLVSKQFKEVVLDSSKNVLVEYYAPWCQHCKNLAPIYTQVADHFKEDSNILIAKLDATANELEGVNIEGYPTIKLYLTQNKSNPIDYVGERDFDSIVNFVNQAVYPDKYPPTTSDSSTDNLSTDESTNGAKIDL